MDKNVLVTKTNVPDMHPFDTRALAEAAGLKVYDYALPLHWYEDVHTKTGYWPQEYGFVWCYDDAPSWGEPIPLTAAASILLAWYTVITKHGALWQSIDASEPR